MVPKEQSVTPETVATFRVKATGDDLEFQWKKECVHLHDDSKYCGTNTGTLCIKYVEKSDKGCYQCLVKSNGKEMPTEAELTVGKFVVEFGNL